MTQKDTTQRGVIEIQGCPVRDAKTFRSFQHFSVDGQKRFEYATFGSDFCSKPVKKPTYVFKNIQGLGRIDVSL